MLGGLWWRWLWVLQYYCELCDKNYHTSWQTLHGGINSQDYRPTTHLGGERLVY